MVLTKAELVAALQSEVRILLHLAGKVDPSMLDYRPTAKQRSTIELLRYLSMMGPMLVRYGLSPDGAFDREAWQEAAKAAEARDFNRTVDAIRAHGDEYATLLADVSEAELRSEMTGFDGSKMSRGAFLVTGVLCGCAAYRTQLFLYLKANGREELTTSNLWRGVDAVPVSA